MEEEDEGGNGWSNILYNPVWILNIRYVCTNPVLYDGRGGRICTKLEDDECGGFVFVNVWTT